MISIIVPVYNVEPYLRRCLDSIRYQTFKELEVILVNDASTDDSGKICEEYVKLDSRFKIIHKPVNEGISAARNTGLEAALGDYIGFVDSDDYIHPQMYETLYRMISGDSYDIAMCDFVKTENDNYDFRPIEKQTARNLTAEGFAMGPYWNLYFCVVWNKLYKKELIEGIKFRGVYAEDQYYNIQVFRKEPRVICCDFKGVAYYQRNNSIVHTDRATKDLEWMMIPIKNYACLESMCKSEDAKFTLLYRLMLLAIDFKSKKLPSQLTARKIGIIERYRKTIFPLFISFKSSSRTAIFKKAFVRLTFRFPTLYQPCLGFYTTIARFLK